MLVWPASSHKGFELAEREKLLTGQLQDRWMGRRMKREVIRGARNLQGKKVIHSEFQISIYLVSSYQVWFLVTLSRDNSVASVSFSSPFHTHSQEPLSWTVCHIPKDGSVPTNPDEEREQQMAQCWSMGGSPSGHPTAC